MSKCENLLDIVAEVEGLLDLLFIGGLYTIPKDIIEKLNNAAAKSCNYGLECGARLIHRIAGGLETRRHSVDYDYTGLTDDYCKLSLYISALKNRIQIKDIEESLMNIEE